MMDIKDYIESELTEMHFKEKSDYNSGYKDCLLLIKIKLLNQIEVKKK